MQKLFRDLQRVAQHHHTVMVLGEHGCGKESVVRAIHDQGPRAARPFLFLDCCALAPSLLEYELFGCARGAIPGALANRIGLLEAGRGGTVFLDEVGGLPMDVQEKLFQVLRAREFQPAGSSRRVKLNARIVSASSRNLDVAVRTGTFRQDLYARLSVAVLRVPPLRDRRGDIPMLVSHFLEQNQPPGQSRVSISDEALCLLQGRDWPGNVRELEICIKRSLAMCAGLVLRCADMTQSLLPQVAPSYVSHLPGSAAAFAAGEVRHGGEAALSRGIETTIPLAELERQAILHAILVSEGDKILAARRLGIGKTTVYRKLKEYGVEV
jgi:DNA-binding NtrC family response regulator